MIRDLFIKLTKETHPYKDRHNSNLMSNVPVELNRDIWGNYWYKIGKSKNMFTCHIDTAGEKSRVNHKIKRKDDKEFVCTDGTTVLGADDKAGMVVLINMIQNEMPGLYYFFQGEEEGGKGSKAVADNFYNLGHTEGIERVISFDRKGYTSIITHQMSVRCCSDEYADKLVMSFANHGLAMEKDPTGRLSDSMSFFNIPEICEITNISVGYFNEHTNAEYQDITFLEKLVKTVCRIDWDSLSPVTHVRESYLIREFSQFMQNRK